MSGKVQFFDAIALSAVVAELQPLVDGRVDKVGQPSYHELYLTIRANGRNVKLYFNLRDAWARLHLTNAALGNVPTPTAFTMLLRKYMEGARLLRVEQVGLERAVRLVVAGRDELGDPYERVLVAELIGKYSNMFLLDRDGQIMGALRSVTEEMCQARQLGTGLPYAEPPVAANKVPFDAATDADVMAAIAEEGKLVDRLSARFSGISRVALAQLLAAAGLGVHAPTDEIEDLDRLLATLSRARESLKARRFHPRRERGPLWEYNVWWLEDGAPPETPGVSALLDGYYGGLEAEAKLAERRRQLRVQAAERLRKQRDRLSEWERSLAKSEGAERERELGDLLTSHMYMLAPGMREAAVTDYFHPDAPTITLNLDPQLTPSENVQRHFRRYQKLRNSKLALDGLLAEGRIELAYLEAIATAIEQATEPRDLDEVAEELDPSARPQPRRGAAPEPPPQPLRFVSSDGLEMLVGKNNKQNEYLTFKLARPNDVWLHTQNIPGSHVVVRADGPVPEATLHEAAQLAAYYSQARDSSQVPVVYALKRHVKKPKGGKLGMAIFEQEKTLFVNPGVEFEAPQLERSR